MRVINTIVLFTVTMFIMAEHLEMDLYLDWLLLTGKKMKILRYLLKERIEASFLSKYEAAIRRERALAYSYSRQKSSRSTNLLFMDATNSLFKRDVLPIWWGTRSWFCLFLLSMLSMSSMVDPMLETNMR